MPEKPEVLNIIALDIDVVQFGDAVAQFEQREAWPSPSGGR